MVVGGDCVVVGDWGDDGAWALSGITASEASPSIATELLNPFI